MRRTLLILAAGLGSRFGGGIKQLEPVGQHNEIIIDYSIHDAIEAGFNKIVFVIRREIENAFRSMIGSRIETHCARLGVEVAYAFQSVNALPEGARAPQGRTKPWGTGQAVLSAKALIHEPFAVINADDYYGKEAFHRIYAFLAQSQAPNAYCMAGYILKNTLSENGGVTRGVCRVENGFLRDIVETPNIVKTINGPMSNGQPIDPNAYVSMNMWGFTPEFMDALEAGFEDFFQAEEQKNPLQAEYLLPNRIRALLQADRCTVKLLATNDKWFGITYKADRDLVADHFKRLIANGVYREALYSDLLEEK